MKFENAIEQLKHASKNPGTLPSIACMKAILKEIERLKNEIADGYCLAYNSLPDREMEDQEDDLCAQINRLTEYIKRRQGEIERLRAIVDKSPKTADGVPITFESTLWVMHAGMLEAVSVFEVDDEFDVLTRRGWFPLHKVYSTREAAEAAREE